jgi:predicted PurR-regulated permease PerM
MHPRRSSTLGLKRCIVPSAGDSNEQIIHERFNFMNYPLGAEPEREAQSQLQRKPQHEPQRAMSQVTGLHEPLPDDLARTSQPLLTDNRTDVPFALRVAASWFWRLGLVIVVGGILIYLLSKVSLLVIPLMIAALVAALLMPVKKAMCRVGLSTGLSTAATLIVFFGVIITALLLVGRQLALGLSTLWGQASTGIERMLNWVAQGPLELTTSQIDQYLQDIGNEVENNSASIVSGALSFGTTAGHVGAGTLLTVFALIFFLLDGGRIWRFVVGLAPVRARAAMDGAGRRGWISMASYVRVQMLVAGVDAVGIGVGAAIIGVPLALPLGFLVFFGSFIPIVGALATGSVAVLLAFVANGWVNALIMLAIVLVVQQLEGHVLQPLIMGPAVALHPLAVVLAVAGGTLLAGIPGALFSVPLLAVVSTSVRYIAQRAWEDDPVLDHEHR